MSEQETYEQWCAAATSGQLATAVDLIITTIGQRVESDYVGDLPLDVPELRRALRSLDLAWRHYADREHIQTSA